jgi:Glycosyltransferase family 87
MIRPRLGPILLALAITFQVTWYILLLVSYIRTPANVQGADFSVFYTAGRIAGSRQYFLLYDIPTQVKIQDSIWGIPLQADEILPFNHPPLLVPVLQIICTNNYISSYLRWLALLACFVVAAGFLLDRLLKSLQWKFSERAVFITAFMLFYPTFISMLKGQDSALLLLGGTLWLYGMLREKDPLAGLGLAMLVIRPQIALLLSIPFIFNRRQVWWWFCGGALALSIYSFLLVGVRGSKDFINLLFQNAGGQSTGMNPNAMFNFVGMALRIFPHTDLAFVQNLAWAIYLAATIGLCILWGRTPKLQLWHLVLASSLSLFIAPHLHFHDLSFLLLPILGMSLILARRIQSGHSRALLVALPLVCSLALLFGDIWDPVRFVIPYLIMLALPLVAWFYATHPPAQGILTVQAE